jgi:hypothetical protein
MIESNAYILDVARGSLSENFLADREKQITIIQKKS